VDPHFFSGQFVFGASAVLVCWARVSHQGAHIRVVIFGTGSRREPTRALPFDAIGGGGAPAATRMRRFQGTFGGEVLAEVESRESVAVAAVL